MKKLCAYWADEYDWRTTEARLNALPQFRIEIDGLGIHFLHARSPHADALPLVLTHGWPGSIVEFLEVLGPLAVQLGARRSAAVPQDPGEDAGVGGDDDDYC